MPATVRKLSADQITALDPTTFQLAPIFDRIALYAGSDGAVFLGKVDDISVAVAATVRIHDELRIEHFAVSPRARGHGMGSKLLQTVIDHARTQNLQRVLSQAPAWCPDWRAFYTRHGFVYTDSRTADSMTDMTPVVLHLRAN